MYSFQRNKIEQHYLKQKNKLSQENCDRIEAADAYLRSNPFIQVKRTQGYIFEPMSRKTNPLPVADYDVFKMSNINSGIWSPVERNRLPNIPEKGILCEVLIVETSHQIFIVDWSIHTLTNPENALLFLVRE